MQSLKTRLADTLKQLPAAKRYRVAFSGGLDSQVLLHAMSSLRADFPDTSLHAIHVNHQLHPESADWVTSCEKTCRQLNVEYHCIAVEVKPETGESLEAVARDKRYEAFASLVTTGDCLLTAHHQDDQAETLLLQLMRGAGPHGLAAMPGYAPFAKGHHARPLLDVAREELEEYASIHSLEWVEDKSNADTRFDRNYMRHEIIPMLRKRWPSMSRTVSRSAQLSAEAASLLDRMAGDALATHAGSLPHTLSVSALKQTATNNGESECRHLLRHWLQQLDLPLPGYVNLQQIIDTVLNAKQDAMPLLHWRGAEVRRYGDDLFGMTPLERHDASRILPWHIDEPLLLNASEQLTVEPASGEGLSVAKLKSANITVQFRQGGERCKPAGQEHTHALKKLLQAWRVPPWQRNRIALVYLDGELAAVAGHCICEGYQARSGEAGMRLKQESVPY